MKRRAFKAAVPFTIPVLTGYLFLGIAYGIFMTNKGFPLWYPVVISLVVYAGSMQFVAVELLLSAFSPVYALLLTLMVNARHLFYGISMLDKVKGLGKKKWYMVFAMSDETFSVLCGVEPPRGVDKGWFMFFIALLHQLYWAGAAGIGALAGSLIPFELKGIEFVMTALFVVIFLNQWMEAKEHTPALTGLLISAVCLVLFKADHFILPSMVCIFAVLSLLRGKLEKSDSEREEGNA